MDKSFLVGFYLFLLTTPVALLVSSPYAVLFILVLCAVFFLRFLAVAGRGSISPVTFQSIVPAGLFCVFILFQLIPLPPIVLKYLSPATWSRYHETIWIASPDLWMTLSVDPDKTFTLLIYIVAYLLVYGFMVHALLDIEIVRKYVYVFACQVGLMAIVSLTIATSSGIIDFHNIFEFPDTQLTGLIVILLPMSWAAHQIVWLKLKTVLADKNMRSFLPWRSKAGLLVTRGAVILALLATFVAGSIMTWLTVFFLILLFSALIGIQRIQRGRVLLLSLLCVVTVCLGYLMSISELGHQYLFARPQSVAVEQFVPESSDSLGIFKDFYIAGTGLGTYQAISSYHLRDVPVPEPSGHKPPHIYQLLVETGLAGFVLVTWMFLSMLRRSFSTQLPRRSRTLNYLNAGVMTSVLALVMTGLAGPGIGTGLFLVYAFILFASMEVVATLWSSGRKNHTPPIPVNLKSAAGYWVPAVLCLLAGIIVQSGAVLASIRYATEVGIDLSQMEEQDRDKLLKKAAVATLIAPLNSQYHIALADIQTAQGSTGAAFQQYVRGVQVSPLSGLALSRLGLMHSLADKRDKAEILMDAASRATFVADSFHRKHIPLLLTQDRVGAGLLQIRHVVGQNPTATGDYLELLRLNDIDITSPEQFLPEMWLPYLILGQKMLAEGENELAEGFFQKALWFSLQSRRPDVEPFLHTIKYYLENDDPDTALEVVLTGLRLFSDNADLRYLSAETYGRLGISYRAAEEYQKALILNPQHKSAGNNPNLVERINK